MNTIYKLLVALIPSVAVLACGGNGASNNDQGISVSFLGLFQSGTTTNGTGGNNLTGCGQLPQPLTGGYISLGQTFLTPTETPQPGFGGLSVDPSGAVHAIVGIQNNMYGQVYRADRVLLEYYIPGSSVQPPSTNVAVNVLAGPAEAGAAGGATNAGLRKPVVTSLPPSFNQICNRAFTQVPIIPSPIREWLNFNSNQLPEAPFDLEVVVKLTGLSSGGNRYETNEGLFSFNVIPEVAVLPSPDTTTTTSTTNTFNTSGASVLSASGDQGADSDAQGLEELENAFETESVIEGE